MIGNRDRRVRSRLAASTFGALVLAATLSLTACGGGGVTDEPIERPNQLVGTWRMVSAVSDFGTPNEGRPFGNRPNGLVRFNADGTFVEVLLSSELAPFTGRQRVGTAAENAAVVGATLGQHGTYTVDERGEYDSNVIETSSWPNLSGMRWSRPVLTLTVTGDRLVEILAPPGQPRLQIEFVRVPD